LLKSKIFSSTILILGFVQLIESIAFGLPFSYFPNYALGLGASVASIGLFTSSFMLATAVMAPKRGAFSDRYGRKKIMMLGIIGDILFGTLTGLAPSWLWLLLIRVIDGAVSSAAMLSVNAILMDTVSSHQRGEGSGFVMAMGMVGRAIGPVFGGTIQWFSHSQGLSLLDSYRVPYFVDSLLAVLALLLVAWKINPTNNQVTSEVKRSQNGSSDKTPIPFSFKVLLIFAFITGISVGFIIPISVLFYNDKFGAEPLEIGFIISLSGFIGLFASWIAGRVSDRIGRKPLIVVGGFMSRISSFALPLTGTVTQAAGILSVRSLGFNISRPAMQALAADIMPAEARGRYFGMFMTAFTSGDIVAPIVSTFLYDMYRTQTLKLGSFDLPGYGLPFYINAVLGVTAVVMLLLLIQEPARSERPEIKISE
jgi:DHA1 family multidrug resistance protein-like MFS transporter